MPLSLAPHPRAACRITSSPRGTGRTPRGVVPLSGSLGTPSLPRTHRSLGYRRLNGESHFRQGRRDNYSNGFRHQEHRHHDFNADTPTPGLGFERDALRYPSYLVWRPQVAQPHLLRARKLKIQIGAKAGIVGPVCVWRPAPPRLLKSVASTSRLPPSAGRVRVSSEKRAGGKMGCAAALRQPPGVQASTASIASDS